MTTETSNARGGVVEICREWLRGCSCANYGTPEDCVECTAAFRSALSRLLLTESEMGEFWAWLRQAYSFTDAGNFTAYNMEVAYRAGREFAAAPPPAAARGDVLDDSEVKNDRL